ncbi:aspartate--tRNA ligase, mitochondrial-like [Lineus longissimus]|uniref:aspartate--tRNA ligase, mitochondrial-like n=1 Tax=Lineus longissimus TaxID=88925 RepID=UPI00315DF4E8
MAALLKCSHIFRNIRQIYSLPKHSVLFILLETKLPYISICQHSTFSKRSHTCGELSLNDVGKEVTLYGWVKFKRMDTFIILRDAYGITQLVLPKDQGDPLHRLLSIQQYENVLEVKGTVQARPPGQENKKLQTGEIEIIVKNAKVLNERKRDLPFEIKEFHKVKEPLRLEYRFLDLRQSQMQANLRLRSQMMMKIREFLCNQHGFVDVETPTLFRRTPGGAREFVVPSKHPGKFYCLPQSPQQFKQLLMAGGIDRYMQIARCYRDESHRPDRQPEFTQLDIEMSFVSQEDIQRLMEELIGFCWPETRRKPRIPFAKMTYHDAMKYYGIDKPDTRFEIKLCNITSTIKHSGLSVFEDLLKDENATVQAINIKEGNKYFKKKDITELSDVYTQATIDVNGSGPIEKVPTSVIRVKEDGNWQGPITKHMSKETIGELKDVLQIEPHDVIVFAAGKTNETCKVMGKIRLKAADLLEEKGLTLRDPTADNFLWVQGFPLFLPREDGQEGLESVHHPFTAAHPDDAHLLKTQPEKIRSQHYDLVLNGQEIGGGSIRIHDSELQKYVLEEVLKEDSSQLSHLLEALEFGCPPHGGIALGLDRLFAIVCGAKSIRDVIAFPKSLDGKDLLSKAPTSISQDEMDYYHIASKD